MKKYIYVLIGFLSVIGLLCVTSDLSRETRRIAFLSGNETLEKPRFSKESGFYEESFLLSVDVSDDSKIYYTLDGSIPDEKAFLYEGPVEIECEQDIDAALDHWRETGATCPDTSACTIRAIAINDKGERSAVVSAIYFIGSEKYKEGCIVSIITDPENLFGENGIYVAGKEHDDWIAGGCEGDEPEPNYLKTGKDWEREIYLDILDCGSSWGQPAGIRIQGASARREYAKRFSVFSRTEYSGSDTFCTPVFGDVRSHSFVIRPGFKNGFISHLVQNRDVAALDAKEALVFINGHFWYPAMIQEKYNAQYFAEHYGVDGDDTIIVKAGVPESGTESDVQKYREIYDFIETRDLADSGAYEEFGKLADVQSFIDFSVVNVYFGNMDYSESKNTICWRVDKRDTSPYGDGRWRWALYDLDLENLNYGYSETDLNTFNLDTHYAGEAFNKRALYAALKRNSDFRRQFVITFMDMINTDFSVENATAVMEDWNVHMDYWRMDDEWCENYFTERNKRITDFISEEFGLSEGLCSVNIKADPEKGRIELNTILPDTSGAGFNGVYFRDYPIALTAEPFAGHRFAGWYVNGSLYSTDKQIELPLTATKVSVEAVYK